MGDHLSPILEGFSNPTMNSAIQMLKASVATSPGKTLSYVQSGEISSYENWKQIVVVNDNLFPPSPIGNGYVISGAGVRPNTTVVSYRFGKSNNGSVYDAIFLNLSQPVMSPDFINGIQYSPPSAKISDPHVIEKNVDFVKSLVVQQKELANSLMSSSKKLGPVSQGITTKDDAYDAAFETDIQAPLPTMSGTLQGFTLIFFTLSFFSLAIIFCININQTSGNTAYAVYAFILFIIGFVITYSAIARLG